MAEFIFKRLVSEAGLSDAFFVASAATSTEEIGNPVYPPAKEMLWQHGITCEGKRAVQLRAEDYAAYDLLVCMDGANVRNATRMCGGDPEGKIVKLMELTDRGGDVADPWYSGRFDIAYRDIEVGCRALLLRLGGAV